MKDFFTESAEQRDMSDLNCFNIGKYLVSIHDHCICFYDGELEIDFVVKMTTAQIFPFMSAYADVTY